MNSIPKNMFPVNEPQATAGTWWRRHWFWFVPMGIVAVFFGLIALTVVGAFAALRWSGACKEAAARAVVEPAVIDALGSPTEEGWFVTGTLNPGRDARLTIPISGPKGRGEIHAVASKSAGKWEFSTLDVEFKATRQRISLIKKKAL